MAATKTAQAKSAQTISGYSTDEQVYATRYKQGKRTVYDLALSPDQIINLIHRPDPEAKNPGNRQIRPKHAADFAKYYLENESWVVPGIILRAPSIFKFSSDTEVPDGSAEFGILSYPKRAQRDIQILDGQHRILGFHIALDTITAQIEKAKDFRARALRTEGGDKGSAAVREAEKMLADAERLRERFYSERVAVSIQVTDDITEYRQMFYDIAEHALGITAAVKARFDNRKVANRALPPVLEHPLLANRVDLEQDRIGRNSPYLLSVKHVSEIVRSALVGVDGRIGKVMERTLKDVDVANNALHFLDLVLVLNQYDSLCKGQVTPEVLRETGLLGSPATLRMLASVYSELKSDKHGWDADQIRGLFEVLEPHLNEPAHANSIWIKHMPKVDSAGRSIEPFRVDAHGPDVRRQNIAAAVDAIVDWAILGKKGAPFLWAKPEPAPAPEPTQDELDLQADIATDPQLGELLEKQATAKAKK